MTTNDSFNETEFAMLKAQLPMPTAQEWARHFGEVETLMAVGQLLQDVEHRLVNNLETGQYMTGPLHVCTLISAALRARLRKDNGAGILANTFEFAAGLLRVWIHCKLNLSGASPTLLSYLIKTQDNSLLHGNYCDINRVMTMLRLTWVRMLIEVTDAAYDCMADASR